jgi:hypothetical protein
MRRSKGQAMPWPLDPQETRLLHRMLAEIDGQFEDIQRQPAGRLHVDLHDFERSFSPRHLRMRKSKGYAALVKNCCPTWKPAWQPWNAGRDA